jgi:hypothetical protein
VSVRRRARCSAVTPCGRRRRQRQPGVMP